MKQWWPSLTGQQCETYPDSLVSGGSRQTLRHCVSGFLGPVFPWMAVQLFFLCSHKTVKEEVRRKDAEVNLLVARKPFRTPECLV